MLEGYGYGIVNQYKMKRCNCFVISYFKYICSHVTDVIT